MSSVAFSYSHTVRDSTVVQDLTNWNGETAGMDTVGSEWLDHASQSHVTATITEFNSDMDLGRETQNHLAREWTENAERAGIDKIAFVAEGITARAVSANLDVPQEIRTFASVGEALRWANA
jgi:hypothetical protein